MREGSPATIEVRDEPIAALAAHGGVSTAFEVRSVFSVEVRDGFALVERAVDTPWIKDYDADRDNVPARWATRFDVRNWGLVSAWDGATRVGGAVIAFDTPGLDMLERRRDLAVLWDIRLAPDWRGRGVGARLFRAAEDWARERGCLRIDVETQNINVPACRFYAAMGCELRRIDRFAYPDLPDEIELLWTKRLG